MEKGKIDFCRIAPFEAEISYVSIDSNSSLNINEHHIHDECEIYVNLSGNVSFAVESSVYPVVPGSIIITRPHEFHHCIYHSNEPHRHLCILFSSAGNEQLFDIFFKRDLGKGNMLLLSREKTEKFKIISLKMLEADSDFEKYLLFFKLIELLNEAKVVPAAEKTENESVLKAISFIYNNFHNNITVSAAADVCGVSINTLERHFRQAFNTTPYGYIRKIRLANAARLLAEGKSVTASAEESGFPNTSGFISLFKKIYGLTPLQYKKAHSR